MRIADIGHLDLDLPKAPSKTRVVVAMSGGVDSSVTAGILSQMGYDVIGITLQLYDHGVAVDRKGACCAGQDIHDARRVADQLGIPHYVLDYEEKFRQSVINNFADSYLQGETPIPCVQCNRQVKFKDLLGMAKDLGAEALATGHYARRLPGQGRAGLYRSHDLDRDQSYFLFATTQAQLDFLRFPLGGIPKSVTRQIARDMGLEVAAKPDSQDICFVPTGNYSKIVEKLRPGAITAGDIVHTDGRVLGKHEGIIHFTVGQRRGIGIALGDGEPLYVIKLIPEKAQVVVGPKSALAVPEILLRDINWLGDSFPGYGGRSLTVKVRSASQPIAATLYTQDQQIGRIVFDEAQLGVSPGQACVFYEGERVLGGGWITRQHVS